MKLTKHQLKQQEVIEAIADQISRSSPKFSTVSTAEDYEDDPRLCLTSIHLPKRGLRDKVQAFVESLRDWEPGAFFLPDELLHITVKSVRTVSDPPNFDDQGIEKVKGVFSKVIPGHKQFNIYFYRLLLFPNNLSLIGMTDAEYDDVILDLDKGLGRVGVPDNKVYANSRYFFCNLTLARFRSEPTPAFKKKIMDVSKSLKLEPYKIDTVTLLACNAVSRRRRVIGTWQLKEDEAEALE